jgi:peptide/nickel transport system substrate-binding protein
VIVRALVAAAALAAPALATAGVRPTWGGTLHVAVPAAPRVTDASSEPGDLLVLRATAAPLLELDARGRLQPAALAEVPALEADGRTFRLRLRPDLVDAAGRRIGAVELAARLVALLQGSPRSPHAFVALPVAGADAVLDGRARALAGVRILSTTELLVTLDFPLPQFPLLLATAPAGIPGAGPFVIERPAAPGEPLLLVRNDRYFEGRPFADALEVHARELRVVTRLLEKGELDLALRPEPVGPRGAPLPALGVTVAIVNAERLGAAAEPLRRALAAIDRAELAQRFVRGAAEPLATFVPPALLPGTPPPTPTSGPAGAPPQRILLLADVAAADQRALAERIQVKLFDRGVRAALDLVDGESRLHARLAAKDWDVALVRVSVLAPDAALAAGQVAWVTRGAAAARRVTAELAQLPPDAALAALDRLARELGIVPLVAAGLRASTGASLQGLVVRPDGAIDVASLWRLGGARP